MIKSAVIRIRLTQADLANLSFVADPAWNVCSSLSVLVFPSAGALRAGLVSALADTDIPSLQLLRGLTNDPLTSPPVLTPHDAIDVRSGDRVVERLRATVTGSSEAELAAGLANLQKQRTDSDLTTASFAELVADALVEYWSTILAPFWGAAQAVVIDDIGFRGQSLATQGLGPTLNSLSPRIKFTGTTLELAHPLDVELGLDGRRPMLIPVAFSCAGGFLAYIPVESDPPEETLCIGYPAKGLGRIWEKPDDSQPEALAGLLGATRASVLAAARLPVTTSEIAERLFISPATASEHLNVLARAGILDRTRQGRVVYYQTSAIGRALNRSPTD